MAFPENIKYSIFICLYILISSCAVQKKSVIGYHFQTSKLDTLASLRSGFSGLMVCDLKTNEVITSYNAHKYFVPASNIKLFTTYACLKTLGDSLEAFRYKENDSTFTFWGTADPTLMHPFFENMEIIDFLNEKAKSKKLIYSTVHVDLRRYGRGWMWDDFSDYYQAEITAFPIFGNIVYVKKDSLGIKILPDSVMVNPAISDRINSIKRIETDNIFEIPKTLESKQTFEQEIPYYNASKVNMTLLQKLIGDTVIQHNIPLDDYALAKYSCPLDTVIRRMLQVSDNMLAEHLLLAAGMVLTDSLSTDYTINTVKGSLMKILPNQLFWVDGSGLSRYNRCTPASIISLLTKMYSEYPESRIFSIMPKGGDIGTLQTVFEGQPKPFIYAKSGSMTGVYNLSGYLITNSGRKMVFSFMNNNFEGKVSEIRKTVEKILMEIRMNY